MPDRYGDSPDPVVDFDSRRQARANEQAAEAARRQRERLAETREAHAPLGRDQSAAVRRHRNDVTSRAESHRNSIRIANCDLCDDDGYAGLRVCDHVDHTAAAARGMEKVRAVLDKKRHVTKPLTQAQTPEGAV